MICHDCAYEADKVKYGSLGHQWFKNSDAKWIAFNNQHSPFGHAACKGCDCAHHDVGTGLPTEGST